MIFANTLDLQEIHTHLQSGLVFSMLPTAKNIIFHPDIETSLREGKHSLVLISWDDYSDDMDLAVPIDPKGSKVELFRTPVLYAKGLANPVLNDIIMRG